MTLTFCAAARLICYNDHMVEQQSPDSGQKVSVLVGHRHRLVREGIARILRDADFTLAGQADTTRAVRLLVARRAPNIILLDWGLQGLSTEALREMIKELPGCAVVILSQPDPPSSFTADLKEGASAYLSVNLTSQELVLSLRLISKGHIIVSEEISDRLKKELATDRTGPDSVLSERELEVLGLVGHGDTNREIAQKLIITENTVKAHLRRILNKRDLRNRQQAASYATQEGLVPEMDEQDPPSRW